MNYLERAQALKPMLTQARRYLHENPEVGFNLALTYQYVWNQLSSLGLSPEHCGTCGIVVKIGPENGNTVLLRADMDGLPMQEESELPFASTNGNAHTCGHDMHTAMLLGAAQMLHENRASLPGCVKLMFQPAEEILQGARDMIDAGILDDPAVGAAFALHVVPLLPTGTLLYNTGTVSTTSDTFMIEITGKGSHGAQPNMGIDPINVAAHTHIALQCIPSREVDPSETVVLTIGCLQAGYTHNIIPETALMRGTLRTFDRELRQTITSRIGQIASQTAESFRASAKFTVTASSPSVINDPVLSEIFSGAFREMLGESKVLKLNRRISQSEDFAEVSTRVPSAMFVIGAGFEKPDMEIGLHNPKVLFDEEALPIGAAVYAQAAQSYLDQKAAPPAPAAVSIPTTVPTIAPLPPVTGLPPKPAPKAAAKPAAAASSTPVWRFPPSPFRNK